MGWTFTHREKGTSNLDWFRREFAGGTGELLDMATKNGTAYGAYRTPDGEVRALVILTRWRRNDYYNFGHKDMDEGMCPSDDDCPERIFNLLTPLKEGDSEWAASWRGRVAAKIAERKARPKVNVGMRVRFPDWRWRGGDYGIVTYLGKNNLFRTQGGVLVRFRGWRNGPYEVVA